jgi:hypothetical protein
MLTSSIFEFKTYRNLSLVEWWTGWDLNLTEFLRHFDKVFGGIEDAMTRFAIKQYFSSQDKVFHICVVYIL